MAASHLAVSLLALLFAPVRGERLPLAGGAFYYNNRMTAAAHGRFENLLRRYP